MNKCIGCGAVLQSTDSNSVGYVKNLDSRLCERCFKIRNYGEYISAIKDENDFIVMLDSINKTNDLVILVCDLSAFIFKSSKTIIKHVTLSKLLLTIEALIIKSTIIPHLSCKLKF